MSADSTAFLAWMANIQQRTETALASTLPDAAIAPPGSTRPCATRCSAAASGCGPCWCMRQAKLSLPRRRFSTPRRVRSS